MTAIGLSEILRAAAVRRVMIGVLTLALFSLVVAYAFLARPTYSASALVEVKAERAELPATQHGGGAGVDAAVTFANVNTEASRLTAEPVVRLVYAEFKARHVEALQRTSPLAGLRRGMEQICAVPPFAAVGLVCDALRVGADRPTDEEANFRAFQDAFYAAAIRGSRLIRIGADAPDPDLAAAMANRLAETYIQLRSEEAARSNAAFVAWLQSRLTEIGSRVAEADLAVAEYRRENNLIEMGRDADMARRTPVTEQLSGMLADLATARSQKAQAEVRLARMREARTNPQAALSLAEVVSSEVMRDLIGRETAARQRVADLRSTFGARHPQMVSANAEINELRARINSEMTRVLEATTQEYERAAAVVDSLTTEVARQQSRAGAEQLDRVRLRDLERRARADDELHAALLRFTGEAVQRASWRDPAVDLVAGAVPPERPVSPKKLLVLPAGLVGSFSFALLLAVGAELRRHNRTFTDPVDLESATGLHVEGTVPEVRQPSRFPWPDDMALAIEAMCMQVVLRGARAIGLGGGSRVYAVTSCGQGDGKSVLALAFARWMQVRAKRRTLLIDADLRRPAVLREAGPTTPAPEWAAALPIRVEKATGLAILSFKDMAEDPFTAMLRLHEILDTLRDSFAVIVVDTPPVLAVPDAIGIARHVDRTLFVVRWAETRRRSLAYALKRFDADTRARTSLVFSRVNVRSYQRYEAPGAERYGSFSGRGYGGHQPLPPPLPSGAPRDTETVER